MPVRDLGVQWFLPGFKRPFMSTPRATSGLIELIAEGGATVSQAQDQINYDSEAELVLQKYIDAGYGPELLSDILANKVSRKKGSS